MDPSCLSIHTVKSKSYFPTRSSTSEVGFSLRSLPEEEVFIPPWGTGLIRTGIAVEHAVVKNVRTTWVYPSDSLIEKGIFFKAFPLENGQIIQVVVTNATGKTAYVAPGSVFAKLILEDGKASIVHTLLATKHVHVPPGAIATVPTHLFVGFHYPLFCVIEPFGDEIETIPEVVPTNERRIIFVHIYNPDENNCLLVPRGERVGLLIWRCAQEPLTKITFGKPHDLEPRIVREPSPPPPPPSLREDDTYGMSLSSIDQSLSRVKTLASYPIVLELFQGGRGRGELNR